MLKSPISRHSTTSRYDKLLAGAEYAEYAEYAKYAENAEYAKYAEYVPIFFSSKD